MTGIRSYFFLMMSFTIIAGTAQQKPEYRSLCDWSNLNLNTHYSPAISDSCVFVVSCRTYDPQQKEFANHEYDTSGTLHYFAVYYSGNHWTAVPYPSLNALLNTKQHFKNMVVFTEGYGKTFTSGLYRATQLMRVYDVDEVFFDWPSYNPYLRQFKNVKTTYHLSASVARSYAKFLEELQAYKHQSAGKFKTLTLLNHSMGNLLLMHGIQQHLMDHLSPGFADQLILNAACVKQKRHNTWLNELAFSKTNYVTINSHDQILKVAKVLFWSRLLGERPKTRYYSGNARYVDFSAVLGKEHNYVLFKSILNTKPFLKQFYNDIFEGKAPQLKFTKTPVSDEVNKYLPEPTSGSISTGG